MNRRRFLTSATSFLLAPALVRASSLDYVPRGEVLGVLTHKPGFIVVPNQMWIMMTDQYGRTSGPHKA